uniref:Uncharacterized protein n=1 Tax=Knipowitschia caucasica TaxID=637954 RepID=A0AAV2JBP4_KNICA
MSEEKVRPFGLVLMRERETQRGMSGVEVWVGELELSLQRRELTTNMSDCGRRGPDRRSPPSAMWPCSGRERDFSILLPLLTELKETHCRCGGNGEEHRSAARWESTEVHIECMSTIE